MDDVRVVEAGDEQAAIEAADELLARRVPAAMTMCSGNGPHGFGAGRPWPVERAAVARGRLRVVDDVAADAGVEERHALLGDALVVERRRRAGRVGAVVDDGHERATPIRLPGSKNERSSWTASAEKPEVAEHVGDVDDRVLLEDDRVVAGLDRDGVAHGPRLLGGLAADRRRVDGRARRPRPPPRSRCRRPGPS